MQNVADRLRQFRSNQTLSGIMKNAADQIERLAKDSVMFADALRLLGDAAQDVLDDPDDDKAVQRLRRVLKDVAHIAEDHSATLEKNAQEAKSG